MQECYQLFVSFLTFYWTSDTTQSRQGLGYKAYTSGANKGETCEEGPVVGTDAPMAS